MDKQTFKTSVIVSGGVILVCIGCFTFFWPPFCFDPAGATVPSTETSSMMSESNISQVIIDYSLSGFPGPDEHKYYIITKADDNLLTEGNENLEEIEFASKIREEIIDHRRQASAVNEQVQRIDKAKIVSLDKSLVNLREPLSMRSCFAGSDYYPKTVVQIFYENGERVILYSNSNCANGNPWNVIAKNQLYVQYTGEIPYALYDLTGIKGYQEHKSFNYLSDAEYKGEIPLEGLPQEITGFGRVLYYAKCARSYLPF